MDVALQESVCLMWKAVDSFPSTTKTKQPRCGVHSYNPSAWEVDAKVSGVQDYPQIQNGFEASLSNMRHYFN